MPEEVIEEEVKVEEEVKIEEEEKVGVKVGESGGETEEKSGKVGESGGKVGEIEEEEAAPEPKKKANLDDRLKQLKTGTYEMREAERQANKARAAAEAATAKLEEAQKKSGNEKPKEDDFDTQEEYIEALTGFKAKQAILEYDANRKQEDAEASKRRVGEESVKDWNYRKEKAMEQYADFTENENMIQKVLVHYGNPIMAQTIIDSEKGIALVQHLGRNIDELERIARMSPISTVKELARLEDKIGKKTVKKLTTAPNPIKPVGGGSGPVSKDYAKMSTADFMKKRNEEVSGGRK